MTPLLDRILWLLLATGHVLPALPLVAPGLLQRLYGVAPAGDLGVLLRHRALLFLVVAAVAAWAAFSPAVRPMALVVVGASLLGFLAIYAIGAPSPALRQIFVVDLGLAVVLAGVAWRLWAR